MALYNGIDPVAFATHGIYTETYTSASGGNIASLFASFGMLEAAPAPPAAGLGLTLVNVKSAVEVSIGNLIKIGKKLFVRQGT